MERLVYIPQATWDAIPPEAQAVVAAVIVALEARIADLEARLNQSSSNSPRPPSSDPPHRKPTPPRLRPRQRRPRAARPPGLRGPRRADSRRRILCSSVDLSTMRGVDVRRDFSPGRLRRALARRTFATRTLPWLRREVRTLLERGSRCGSKKTAATCREVLKIEPSLWTFARVEGVEPTNNAAEREVRHAVCWRKTSFGTDSPADTRFVERMRTAIESCRRQSRDLLDFLLQAVKAHRSGGSPPPTLIPTEA